MDAQFGQIRRAVPVQRLHRLRHLDGVAGGAAQRLVHVGDERRRPFARAGADVDHRLRQGQRVLLGLHKGAGAGLNVQQNRICTGGNLLAHDAGGDQRQAVHRGGDVPQSVNLLVRHRQLPTLADQRDADLVDDVKEFLLRQGGAVTGNRFQLIHRPAGEAQPPAGHLGDGDAAGGGHRRSDQGGLVPHAAGGVLVHLDTRDGGQVGDLPGARHRQGHRGGFLLAHPLKADRHQKGRHLVIGNRPFGEARNHPVQLLLGQ